MDVRRRLEEGRKYIGIEPGHVFACDLAEAVERATWDVIEIGELVERVVERECPVVRLSLDRIINGTMLVIETRPHLVEYIGMLNEVLHRIGYGIDWGELEEMIETAMALGDWSVLVEELKRRAEAARREYERVLKRATQTVVRDLLGL